MPAVQLGEPRLRDTPDAAVRAHLVVVTSPVGNRLARLPQRPEPVLVEALVADMAVILASSGNSRQPDQPEVMQNFLRSIGPFRAIGGSNQEGSVALGRSQPGPESTP
jgi:hypothetical protein